MVKENQPDPTTAPQTLSFYPLTLLFGRKLVELFHNYYKLAGGVIEGYRAPDRASASKNPKVDSYLIVRTLLLSNVRRTV